MNYLYFDCIYALMVWKKGENPPDGGVYVVVLQNTLVKPHCINE